ncbi:hypothetical protein [Kitasatospora sp. NPDC006786]|uniref:hypothetical protein n=1 Tax=unclassified Kitasatospora TaxID=2633591 RepID=UPI003406AE81
MIGTPGTDRRIAEYSWRCLACGDDSGFDTDHLVDRMRHLANRHAGECRALPAATGDTADAGKAGARS